jgi:hypothetical protein
MYSLKAGAAKADITPPLNVGLLTSSVEGKWAPFHSVRMPLMVRVIVIQQGKEEIALISLDMLGLTDTSVSGWNEFKRSISSSISPEKIIINCTHTHNAPESVALTDLYKSGAYIEWLHDVKNKVARCIEVAKAQLVDCKLYYGVDRLAYFSLQRRVPTDNGMVITDSLQPISEELFQREPVDRRIKVLRFIKEDGSPLAIIIHAVCHPVHEMCIPEVSPDYPGELCYALDNAGTYGMSMFLNGTAGDINPPTVSNGKEHAKRHGLAIADIVSRMEYKGLKAGPLKFLHREITLPSRNFKGMPGGENCIARISVANLGNVAIVFLPGEPFVQTGLEIENGSPFEHTIVTGYSENSIGYLPPASAFNEGGYETGPGKWSYLNLYSERIIQQTVRDMLAAFETIIA